MNAKDNWTRYVPLSVLLAWLLLFALVMLFLFAMLPRAWWPKFMVDFWREATS